MSTFKFGQIRVDVDRKGPDPANMASDLYTVRISGPEETGWIASVVPVPRRDRTSATAFDLASEAVVMMEEAWRNPIRYVEETEGKGISPEEVNATIELGSILGPYLEEAVQVVLDRQGMYSEYREGPAGPLEFGINGRRRKAGR